MTSNLDVPMRALAIGAHPDDIEINCGGTLAKWAESGCDIFHLVLTDGSKGSWDANEDAAALVLTRHEEQREAARRLGGTAGVVFLDWPDGELENSLRQRWQVAAWIRRVRPEVIFAHDPWKRYRIHTDHRNAGFLVTDAIVAARDPLYFPELGAAPHRPSSLLLFEADEIDHIEDIDDLAFSRKIAALLAHESQLVTTMHFSSDDSIDDEDERRRYSDRLKDEMRSLDDPSRLIEGFKLVVDL